MTTEEIQQLGKGYSKLCNRWKVAYAALHEARLSLDSICDEMGKIVEQQGKAIEKMREGGVMSEDTLATAKEALTFAESYTSVNDPNTMTLQALTLATFALVERLDTTNYDMGEIRGWLEALHKTNRSKL